jgi:hypothetical protein
MAATARAALVGVLLTGNQMGFRHDSTKVTVCQVS